MQKTENSNQAVPLDRVEVFKKMCRLLEVRRRHFLESDWRHYAKLMTQQQFIHLMTVREALPCNLSEIMRLTGLTSAGASLFVDKMVKRGVFLRRDDPRDRRNVVIELSERAVQSTTLVNSRLNRYIFGHFEDCTAEELHTLEAAARIICGKLDTPHKDKK